MREPDAEHDRLVERFTESREERAARLARVSVTAAQRQTIARALGWLETPMPFDPYSPAEQKHEGVGMLAMALAHAQRGLADPAYQRTALEAIAYYLEQMVNDDDVPVLEPGDEEA